MRLLTAALVLAIIPACSRSPAPPLAATQVEFLTPYGPTTFPFSPAVRAGGMLYLSGQIGTDSTHAVVPGGIGAETKQTLENIQDVLQRSGSSMDRVVKCLVFMTDLQEWPAMNEVYKTYFTVNKPARSAVGVDSLVLGAKVEIECIAAAGAS